MNVYKNKVIKIAIQGFKGSYSHQAVKRIFEKEKIGFQLIENNEFHQAFDAIEKNGLGLIPVENSTAGFVDKAIDELVNRNLEIFGEYFLNIEHCLHGVKGSKKKDIKKVFSHHQALAQTSDFLKKNKIQMVDFGDTAGGAEYVKNKNERNSGAIGSEILAKIYDLEILDRKINNEKNNTTRFLLIGKKNKKKIKNDLVFEKNNEFKNTLIFRTRDIPGALYKALGGFATNGVNLTNIISRPIRGRRFGYLFYLEFEGKIESKEAKNALEELEFFAEEIRFLGNYKEIEK